MKRLLILVLCSFFLLSACGDDADSRDIGENLLTGRFLRISDSLCLLVLDGEARERYPNDAYMRLLTDHPFVEPDNKVSLDGFSDGDRIAVDCMTIADLSPRVIDVTAAELLEEGTLEDVDTESLAALADDGDVSDIDAALLEWLGK